MTVKDGRHISPRRRSLPLLPLWFRWLALPTITFLYGAYRAASDVATGLKKLLDAKDYETVTTRSTSLPRPSFSLAYTDSLGFFDDIPDSEWKRLRTIAISSGLADRRLNGDGRTIDDDGYWTQIPPLPFYSRNFDPNFACRFEVRVGGTGDGPKFTCDPHRIPDTADFETDDGSHHHDLTTIAANDRRASPSSGRNGKRKRCLVYSVGSAGIFRFEFALQAMLGSERRCEIHVFDVDDYASKMPKMMDIHFHQWGFKRDNGPTTDESPDENYAYPALPGQVTSTGRLMGRDALSYKYHSLSQTMKLLGHAGRTIDVLQIDCEGCEWSTYRDWIRGTSLDGSVVVPPPRQILVELHKSPPPHARSFFDSMRRAGYVVFHKEPNLEGCGGTCVEYGFLKMRPEFYDE